jgi:hypothetical protein
MANGSDRSANDEQIAGILLEIERRARSGQPLAEALAAVRISRTTYYRWRQSFEGLSTGGGARFRDLPREPARLRRIVADQALEIEMLRELTRGTY